MTLTKLGISTDNGAFLNYNKVVGNARRPLPAGVTAEGALLSTLALLRAKGVPVGYIQLDDWWYEGRVYEGAVACVDVWEPRADWFPSGLRALGVPLMLYMPYFCASAATRHPQVRSYPQPKPYP